MARTMEVTTQSQTGLAGEAQESLPRHIAVIMDGNGRWAQKKGLPRSAGHEAGMRAVRRVVEECAELQIEALTLYTFSTENWSRPQHEVRFLMDLLIRYLRSDLDALAEANVQVRLYGDPSRFSPVVRSAFREAVRRTRDNTGLILGLAFNYGGRDEIARAVQTLAAEVKKGTLDPADITADRIEHHLYTAGLPDPDLIIRTGGELRLSNFLLWQAAYSEFWWTESYWPDFDGELLLEALEDYRQRSRRFGGLKK